MPYIHASIAPALGKQKIEAVKTMLGQTISILPGKSEAVLMLRIDDDVPMYFRGEAGQCAILAVHLYKASPLEAKKQYAREVMQQLCLITGLPADRVFLNFTEHDDWAANGELIQR